MTRPSMKKEQTEVSMMDEYRSVTKLKTLGFAAHHHIDRKRLYKLVAEAVKIPLPNNLGARRKMLVNFAHDGEKTPVPGPREFKPLVVSKPLQEAIARAHEYHIADHIEIIRVG